jgi:hypothetical protein
MKRAFIVFLTVMVAGGLFAQSPGAKPIPQINSPAKDSMFGRIGLPIDDIVNPNQYTGIQFDKWIGYMSFASFSRLTGNTSERGYLGAAAKIGGVYVGVYYGGNFGYGYFSPDYYTKELMGSTDPNGKWLEAGGVKVPGAGWAGPAGSSEYKPFKVFDTVAGSPESQFEVFNKDVSVSKHRNDNRTMVLIGLADMGFRFGYASTHTGYMGKDLAINPGTDSYEYWRDFSIAHGWIIPQFSWGMAKNLLEGGLRPLVTVDWGFARNYQRGVYYNTAGEHIEYSKNYMEPVITAGLNGYNYYKSANGWTFNADADYQLGFRMFNNDYSVPDLSGFSLQTKSIKGFYDPDSVRDIYFNEYSYMSHQIRVWTTMSYGDKDIDLRARFYLPVTLRYESDSPMVLKADGSGDLIHAAGRYNGSYALIFPEKSTSDFTFSPLIELAARCKIIPDRLNLNLGGKFQQAGIGWTDIEYVQYYHPQTPDANRSPNEIIKPDGGNSAEEKEYASFTRHTLKYGDFITEFKAGFTFYFSKNVALDASTGIMRGNDLSLSGTTGLTNFGSIMAIVTF